MMAPSAQPTAPLNPPVPHRALRPRLAACLALTRHDGKTWRLLMGRRAARHVFMPNTYVFPGGRVDRADGFAPAAGAVLPESRRLLETVLTPRRARATALAAVREAFEETRWALMQEGMAKNWPRHAGWDMFRAHGFLPYLTPLRLFARAITPPGKPRRFDTWFFHADSKTAASLEGFTPSGELEDIAWYRFEEARGLHLPNITRHILDALERTLHQNKRAAFLTIKNT